MDVGDRGTVSNLGATEAAFLGERPAAVSRDDLANLTVRTTLEGSRLVAVLLSLVVVVFDIDVLSAKLR